MNTIMTTLARDMKPKGAQRIKLFGLRHSSARSGLLFTWCGTGASLVPRRKVTDLQRSLTES